MGQFFEYEMTVDSRDVDGWGRCRPSAVLGYLQEAATLAAEDGGFGREKTLEYHAFWMLARIWFRLDRPLRWEEKVTVRTWHRGSKTALMYRDFDLLAGGASLISAAIMTLMVNARHLFYGISMLERYKDTGAAKPYLIFALTDETYSVVCSGGVPEGVDRKKYYFWVSLLNQLYWIAGGVAGALLGSVLPFDTTGIDFSMTALFLVVMTEQWKASRDHTPALVGLGVSLVCLLVFGSSDFLIPSMVGITAALTVLRGFMQKKEADHAV